MIKSINAAVVAENEIAIFWLGQAGFLIKDNKGRMLTIDPYLSDCCERFFGFKRLSPKLISPDEIKTDVLLSTHDHLDHFDIDAIPIIMKNKNTLFVGSKTCEKICIDMGIRGAGIRSMAAGETMDLGWLRLTAVYADHGDLAPDAIGVLIDINGVTIYYTGDTAYRPEKMQTAIAAKPDIIILPINGAYGNLNSEEAAKLVKDTNAKVAIPCHFWTFAAHGGDPQKFADEMKKTAPDAVLKFFCQGEMYKHICQ